MAPPRLDPSPGSTSTLRSANQQRVLDVLRRSPVGREDDPCPDGESGPEAPAYTQAEIARATGLAPATVSNIVRELTGGGLVETEAGAGRRGSSVRLAREAGVVAGIDFGHTHVAVAVADLTGQVLAEEWRDLPAGASHEQALALAHRLYAGSTGGRAALRHVGLGLPAPLTDDVVGSSWIFPGWEGIDARAATAAVFGAPVTVENDANLGALAEHRLGVARGHHSSVFVKISSGVGAGIVIADEIFRGAGGTAGEIGHLTIDEQGPMCRCGGRGCLEAYASSTVVLGLLGEQLPGATLAEVVDAAQAGAVAAQRAIGDAGLHLGWGVASIVNLLNPAIVVVGGDMARAGELLLEPARVGLRRHALGAVADTPVVASELGRRASLVGAVLLAAESTELLLAG